MNMIKCALQISKGAAQRGRTEGAVLPVRRSAPEHNPYMFSKQHSTTARWIRLGVNFEEGGNRSARRKLKSYQNRIFNFDSDLMVFIDADLKVD